MLRQEEIAKIRAYIDRLEKARDESTDSRIMELIEAWIKGAKADLGIRQESNVARYHL